jgi:hypothetical protein
MTSAASHNPQSQPWLFVNFARDLISSPSQQKLIIEKEAFLQRLLLMEPTVIVILLVAARVLYDRKSKREKEGELLVPFFSRPEPQDIATRNEAPQPWRSSLSLSLCR